MLGAQRQTRGPWARATGRLGDQAWNPSLSCAPCSWLCRGERWTRAAVAFNSDSDMIMSRIHSKEYPGLRGGTSEHRTCPGGNTESGKVLVVFRLIVCCYTYQNLLKENTEIWENGKNWGAALTVLKCFLKLSSRQCPEVYGPVEGNGPRRSRRDGLAPDPEQRTARHKVRGMDSSPRPPQSSEAGAEAERDAEGGTLKPGTVLPFSQ